MASKHIPRHMLDLADPALCEKLGVQTAWADYREDHQQSYAMLGALGYDLVDKEMAAKLGISPRMVNAEGVVRVGQCVLMFMDRTAFAGRSKQKEAYAYHLREQQREEYEETEERLVAESKGR